MRIIAEGLQFPEGPVALDDGSVLLVEIARQTLTRVGKDGSTQILASIPGGPNGAALGPDGRVYICNNGGFTWHVEAGTYRPLLQAEDYACGSIDVFDLATGKLERMYDRCGEFGLRGPNDLVFDGHGGFWFTDLGKRRARDIDLGAVYYAKADGSGVTEVIQGMFTPNGIGLSPDGATLYVAETATGRVWSWPVTAPGQVLKRAWPAPYGGVLLANLPGATRLDSLAVSASGQVCVAALDKCGVVEISPDGNRIRHHPAPDLAVTNICFGGADMRTAFVTLSHHGRLAAMDWHEPGLRLHHAG